jgi:hypothetical protein
MATTTTTTTTDIKFACASCGKEYRWKPELAGKQAKCKCGATITVPRNPPPPPVPRQAEVDLDGLYALAAEEKKAGARLASDPEAATTQQGYRCPSCGTELPVGATVCPNCSMDMKTGRKRAAQGARSNGVAAASAGFAMSKRGGGTGKQLSIKGGGKFDVKEPEGFPDFNPVRDLYAPLALIAVGAILYFFQVRLEYGTEEAGEFGQMFLLVNLVSDVLLMGVAMLICLKFINTGEKLPQTMLKFIAVAFAPTAVGGIVEYYVGEATFSRLGWAAGALASIGLCAVLIKFLFNLHKDNASKIAVTIYLVRRWGKFLMFIVLVVVLAGMIVKKVSDAAAKGGGDETEDVRPSKTARPTSPADQAAKLNQEAEKALAEDKMFEAREWLKGEPGRTIYNLGDQAAPTVESLYTMGAAKVSCGATAEGDGGKIATMVVVELPAEPEARAKLIDWANTTDKKLNGEDAEAIKDVGQKYVTVNFDNS